MTQSIVDRDFFSFFPVETFFFFFKALLKLVLYFAKTGYLQMKKGNLRIIDDVNYLIVFS